MARPRDVRVIPDRIGKQEACRLLGLGGDKFASMVERGELPSGLDGGYDPIALVAAYAFYISEGGVRTRLDAERVKKLQRENALLEGNFVEAEDMREWFEEWAHQLVAALETIPARLSVELIGVTDGAVIKQISKGAVSAAREMAAASLDAHFGATQVGDRNGNSVHPEAAAAEDTGSVGGSDADIAEDERRTGTVAIESSAVHDPVHARRRRAKRKTRNARVREPDGEE